LPIVDLDWRLSISLPIADCRLPIADWRLAIADCRLPIADCRLAISLAIGDVTADCRLVLKDSAYAP